MILDNFIKLIIIKLIVLFYINLKYYIKFRLLTIESLINLINKELIKPSSKIK